MNGWRKQGLVLGIGLTLLAAACSSSGTSKTTNTTASGSAANVKYDTTATQTYFLDQEPTNWNDATSAGNEFDLVQIVDRVWPQVFHVGPNFVPTLDTNLMVSATQTSTSPQTIVYKINPAAKWADGVPISADDFIYNWQAQSGNPSLTDVGGKPYDDASTTGYSQIQSVAATNGDPDTVTVIFKSLFGDWKALFSNPGLAPAHIAKTVGWNTGFTPDPKVMVSGGPFAIQSYNMGTSLTIVRNPNYWGPPANLASVTYRFITDSSSVVPAFQNGEVNAGFPTPQLDLVNELKQVPGLTSTLASGLEFEHLDFNEKNTWLKDPAVRKAIATAIDRPALIAKTVGQFDASVTPLENRQFVPGQPAYKDTSGGKYDHGNVAAAKAILTAAGYTYGADGTVSKGGQPVTMRITSTQGNSLRADEEQYVAAQAALIGIKVTEADTSSLGGTLSKGDFDLIIFAWVSTPFPSGNDSIYQTITAAGAGGQNYVTYSNPQVDSLFTQAENTADNTTRLGLYNQVDTILWNDMATLPLFQRPTLIAYQSKYLNMHNNPSSEGPVYNEEQWGVKAAA